MNIQPKLNLNKHPKDCDNLSLIAAKNVKLSNDMSCLTNEEGIELNNYISDYFASKNTITELVGCIPCNTELVLFTSEKRERRVNHIKAEIVSITDLTGLKFYIRLYSDFAVKSEIKCNISYIQRDDTKTAIVTLKNNTKETLYNIGSVTGYDCELTGIVGINKDDYYIYDYNNTASSDIIFLGDFIYRYNEKTNEIYLALNKWKWSGGKIKGTFTYNVENELIICVAEYEGNNSIDIPLKTINLGKFGEDAFDNKLEDKHFAISPELEIPSISSHEYISGSAYKGWYYLFIRYKINKSDYTQWFNFAYPIFVDNIEPTQLFRYNFGINHEFDYIFDRPPSIDLVLTYATKYRDIFPASTPDDGYCFGTFDCISDNTDVSANTFLVNINFPDTYRDYNMYQIGIICASKSYTKCWRTSDIVINNISKDTYIFDVKQLVEESAENLINENYNYFNVKNIINYKNRLYISNYNEHTLNNKIINNEKEILNNVSISLIVDNNINLYTGKSLIYDANIKNTMLLFSKITNTTETDKNILQYFTVYDRDAIENRSILNKLQLPLDTLLHSKGKKANITLYKDGNRTDIDNVNLSSIILEAYTSIENGKLSYNIPSYMMIRYNYEIYDYIHIYTDTSKTDYISISSGTYSIYYTDLCYYNKDTFDYRKTVGTTLLPDEVYNFFIHFVDKYGHVTNGYRLENKNTFKHPVTNINCIPLPIDIVNVGTKYILIPEDTTFKNLISSITDNTLYDIDSSIKNYNLSNGEKIEGYDIITLQNLISIKYGSFINENIASELKIYQVINTGVYDKFGIFINNNGDRLWRIPENKYYIDKNNDGTIAAESLLTYTLNVDVPKLPDGYIGWFISYEKFESINKVTGFLTKNDAITNIKISGNDVMSSYYNENNAGNSSKMYFYSSKFDISDSLILGYNGIKLEIANGYKEDRTWQNILSRNINTKYPFNLNKPLLDIKDSYINNKFDFTVQNFHKYYLPNSKLCVADSVKDGRGGLGTALELDDIGIFKVFSTDDKHFVMDNTVYTATLCNYTLNLYMSNNKELFRLSDIYYGTGRKNIVRGLPGVVTYDGVHIYNSKGVQYNSSTFDLLFANGKTGKYIDRNVGNNQFRNKLNPFVQYVQFPVYDTYFYESKKINNIPTPQSFPIKGIDGTTDINEKSYYIGQIIEPKNSIDLFVNPQGSQQDFNLKLFTNFRDDVINIDRFDKTIRRSNIMQDESKINAWRTFPVEGYKNITENKGIITNLVGIGTYLLAHTEHSLFMFNTDSTLKTNNRDIQLQQQDAFEVDYVEVFTSDKGYGGLQDDLAFILDQFGYIYYNNDFNHLYQFNNGQLNIIDGDIQNWLLKRNPYNVRFANDKFNNRLLIKFDFNIDNNKYNEVISYHPEHGSFISLHDYYFIKAYNTKTELYLYCGGDEVRKHDCLLHNFSKFKNYGYFDILPIVGSNNYSESLDNGNNIYKSYISIILNSEYDTIKFLEYIEYNLRKINKNFINDISISPVEGTLQPYAGDIIRIFSEYCDTLDINVKLEEINKFNKYKKPRFNLGNWNFNYFRNNIINHSNILPSDKLSRIYGNYIIIKFIFDNNDGCLVEFENLNGSISKNTKI